MESCRQWVLLADPQCDTLAWLQGGRSEIALPLTSPRRFVPGYQIRVPRRELVPLEFEDVRSAKVLVVVGRTARGLSLNLKAPVVLNLQQSLGRQIVTNGELPVHYEVGHQIGFVRRSA